MILFQLFYITSFIKDWFWLFLEKSLLTTLRTSNFFSQSNFLYPTMQTNFSKQETTYNYPDNPHKIKDLIINKKFYTQIVFLQFAVYL